MSESRNIPLQYQIDTTNAQIKELLADADIADQIDEMVATAGWLEQVKPMIQSCIEEYDLARWDQKTDPLTFARLQAVAIKAREMIQNVDRYTGSGKAWRDEAQRLAVEIEKLSAER